MICKKIPKTVYCRIGGSGTQGCEFPEDLNMEGITLLKRDMEFETPFGVTACMKLYEVDASITADHKTRQVLYVLFHGWKGLSPYSDTPSERIFWTLREAGVKYILADGSGGGINPLLEPGDITCPRDFIDYTKRVSYLGKLTPYSMRMRKITCPDLHRILSEKASGVFRRVFRTGIHGVAEAPRFESAAEIQKMYADHCDVCGQIMMPEAALARAIGACYAALYVISNSAEGINPNQECSIFDTYSECAPVVRKVMLEAMVAIGPETMNCHYGENIIEAPKAVQNRLDMQRVYTEEETIMKHLKLFIALALTATMTVSLAGCQSKAASSPDAGTQTAADFGETDSNDSASKRADAEAPADGQTVPSGGSGPFRVAFMIGIGGLGDDGFSDSMLASVEAAKADYGTEYQLVEPKEISEFEASFTDLSASGKYDLIIGGGFDAVEVLQRVASEFPEQRYLFMDGEMTGYDSVTSVLFKDNEKTHLMGTVAGLNTKTNKIGMVVGVDSPSRNIFVTGYMAGAKAANPDVEVIVKYVGSFTDTTTAKELALAEVDAGADVIFAAAGGSGLGVFNAAQQGTFKAIGAGVNQCPIDPDHIILSAIREIDVAIKGGIKSAIDGTPEGGTMVPGLKEDALGITNKGSRVEIDPASLDATQTAKDKIIFGGITAPSIIDEVK